MQRSAKFQFLLDDRDQHGYPKLAEPKAALARPARSTYRQQPPQVGQVQLFDMTELPLVSAPTDPELDQRPAGRHYLCLEEETARVVY